MQDIIAGGSWGLLDEWVCEDGKGGNYKLRVL